MTISGPVEMIYGLTIIFLVLIVLFLTGKGSSLIVGHNTLQEPKFDTKKLSKAIGGGFAVLTVLLGVTSIFWNFLPGWYGYLFLAVIGIDIMVVILICHANLIIRK